MKGSIFAPLLAQLAPAKDVSLVEWIDIDTVRCFRKRAEQALCAPSLVIGWSLGSLVALELAGAYPERVKRLVLIGGTSRFMTDDTYEAGWHRRIVERMKKQLYKRPDETIAAFLASLWAKGEEADISAFVHHERINELAIGLDYLLEADARPFLPELDMPLLLIHGVSDTICPPEAARYIAEQARNARFALLPDAGHVPFVTNAAECARIIQTWAGGSDD